MACALTERTPYVTLCSPAPVLHCEERLRLIGARFEIGASLRLSAKPGLDFQRYVAITQERSLRGRKADEKGRRPLWAGAQKRCRLH